jgi:hypothetical protein
MEKIRRHYAVNQPLQVLNKRTLVRNMRLSGGIR